MELWLSVATDRWLQQSLIDEQLQCRDTVEVRLGSGLADHLRRFRREPAREDPEPLPEAALGISQQVVAPRDRCPHRLVSGRRIVRPTSQHIETAFEAGSQRFR